MKNMLACITILLLMVGIANAVGPQAPPQPIPINGPQAPPQPTWAVGPQAPPQPIPDGPQAPPQPIPA